MQKASHSGRKNADIEILRGLSVLLVFLYHLQIPAFARGYLGVDIFFVISGFLMAALYGDMKSGVDIRDFYARRFNRLLPAYFAVLAACLAAGVLLAVPHEFSDMQQHVLWSLALSPNIGFWMDNSYFDKAQFKPFLHFWSLGVELQYYLIFPAFVLLFRRWRWLFPVILIGTLAAHGLVDAISPKTGFFLTPFRLWEFFIGFACAKISVKKKFPAYASILCLCMLILSLILYPALSLNITALSLFVCLASAGIIVFGLPAALSGSALGKTFQTLGTYSYSIYLVHFPVIAFLCHEPFEGLHNAPSGTYEMIVAIALTAAGAVALHHLVENPFRKSARPALRYAAYSSIALLFVLLMPGAARLEETRFSPQQLQAAHAWMDRSVYRCGKWQRLIDPFSASCLLTPDTGGERLLLVGDSHADALKTALAETAKKYGALLRLMKQNYALGAGYTPAAVMAEAKRQNVGTILLHSTTHAVHPHAVGELVSLAEAEDMRVVFIEPTPHYGVHIPQLLFSGNELPRQTLEDYKDKNKDVLAKLPCAKNFSRLAVAGVFCHSSCDIVTADGAPLYFDGGHLTLTGAQRLKSVFELLFAE